MNIHSFWGDNKPINCGYCFEVESMDMRDDGRLTPATPANINFNPHPSYEGRLFRGSAYLPTLTFQSTSLV